MLPEIINNKLQEVTHVLKEHKVKKAFAFGSVCTPHFNQNSDIDLLVSFNEKYFDGYVENFFSLEEKLAALLGRNIDITTTESLQNPYFVKSVNETKTLIYE